ncbi:CBS domain-containing protein CBSCBSPB3-like [Phragmites australis]|uniref:CBS domain-containing protein CBSCBSPB3-like n=1 Tax=Phragmites australis TaxID=29695 RepID=UPI002D777E75|nr:CBS domain-containing protein CBSCBSPB3-like [Phragmites australis]
MSVTAAVAPNRRTRSRPPSAASSRRSDDPSAAAAAAAANGNGGVSSKPASPNHAAGERTVQKLRLSKALTIPEGTAVSEACRRMVARRVDAVLLTDANGLLSGIVTDKDIATRVIAEGLRVEQTIISKIMTRNPVYVMADTLAIEALQKMVQGKFRHLPVVENGEVIAMLDIAKCLYDAISRLEKAAEQGVALAAAVEGVERQVGGNFSAPHTLIETLRERMFKPSLSTIITENTKVATVTPSDPVYVATQKMRELRVNSVIITAGNSLQGIFTSKDVLMRVVAQNLSPELTPVEKVMTAHPDCATLDTTILDALHIMHDGKFLHIPVLDGDGRVAACLDVLQLTHATISMVEGGPGTASDVASTIMQKFWDSALALEPPEEEFDSHSELSLVMPSEVGGGSSSIYPPAVGNSCAFKLQDQKGRMHRFTCGSESLDELMSSVMQRLGIGGEKGTVQLLYEDDEGDRVLLMTDSDLSGAVLYAKTSGLKALRLHIDDSGSSNEVTKPLPELASSHGSQLTHVHYGLMACAIALTGVALMVYLKHSKA